MAKTVKVLMSEQGLPDSNNGSWTQRLKFFLESDYNVFDYVICGPTRSNQKLNNVQTIYDKVIKNRYILKIFPNGKFKNFLKSLEEIIKLHDFVEICVMDNIRLNNELALFLEKQNLESRVRIVFYHCGFSYFLSDREHIQFCRHLNEIIFLTKSGYTFNKNKYSQLVPKVSILNNPVNKQQFHSISKEAKSNLLYEHGLKDKTVFLWLSHDRPKKGLKIILEAWANWAKDRSDVELLIVGSERKDAIDNVRYIGRIPSNEVHLYYQLAHIFLFPTLWKEGFGLSLAQAITSGCYCLAASNGGVEDYMSKSDGLIIDGPNFIDDWILGLEKAYQDIRQGWENNTAGSNILSYEQWSEQFAGILNANDSKN